MYQLFFYYFQQYDPAITIFSRRVGRVPQSASGCPACLSYVDGPKADGSQVRSGNETFRFPEILRNHIKAVDIQSSAQ